MSLVIDRLLKILDVAGAESTVLTVAADAGDIALTVDSIEGFSNGDHIFVGDPGEEGAEIVKIGGVPSGNTIVIGALTWDHGAHAQVISCAYNKIKVYRSDTEGGTYAEITGSPFTMEADQPFTYAIDPTGTLAKWYKYSYFNSDLSAESDKSAASLGGGSLDGLCTLQDVKKELNIALGDKNSDTMLLRLIDSVTDRIIKYTGVQFVSKAVTDEYQDIEEGQDKAFVSYYPIYGTPTVYDNGEALTYNADPDLTEFFLYPGYVESAIGAFYPGNKRFKINYTAYQEPPNEIRECAIQMVACLSGLKTRTFIDATGIVQSVTITSVPKEIYATLDRYKRRSI
jgi:hypothetical protein